MSVASEIARLTGLRNRLKTKLKNLGLLSENPRGGEVVVGNDLEACTQAVENISGSLAITNTAQRDVAGYQYAQVSDPNLVSQNIAEGVTILGITGTHSGSTPSTPTQTKSIYLGGAVAPNVVYPDSGYLLSAVYPAMAATPTLIPENIKAGITIQGVTGTYGSTFETNTASVTKVSQRRIRMQVDFNSFSQLIFLNVEWIATAAYVNGKVLSIRVSRVDHNSFGRSAMYIDETTSKVEYQTFDYTLSSNGELTIHLPANSAYTFGNSYFCTYCYTV